MTRLQRRIRYLVQLACTLLMLLVDALGFLLLCPSPALTTGHLFQRKQLAL